MQVTLEAMLAQDTMELVRDRSQLYDMPQPSMAVSAIVIVEALHDDGQKYLHTFRPDETPAWAAVGMARAAMHNWLSQSGWEEEG